MGSPFCPWPLGELPHTWATCPRSPVASTPHLLSRPELLPRQGTTPGLCSRRQSLNPSLLTQKKRLKIEPPEEKAESGSLELLCRHRSQLPELPEGEKNREKTNLQQEKIKKTQQDSCRVVIYVLLALTCLLLKLSSNTPGRAFSAAPRGLRGGFALAPCLGAALPRARASLDPAAKKGPVLSTSPKSQAGVEALGTSWRQTWGEAVSSKISCSSWSD